MKILITILGLLVMPSIVLGYSSGPPDEVTGAPGEGICVDCHTSFPLNSGNGSLAITGPAQFLPGHTYPVTVTIQDAGQQRWGFEFTPLTQGTCAITDATHTQMQIVSGKAYVKHTTGGTYNGTVNGPISWTFNWTAPISAPAQITFYAAGNAANGNGNNQGDYIYSTSFTADRTTAIGDQSLTEILLPGEIGLSNYPNPFNVETKISFNLPEAGAVNLTIYDITGRSIRTLVNEYQPAGIGTITWDGKTNNGNSLASGIYFVRLAASAHVTTHRVVLLK
jgi:hypothetical protein